MFRWIRLLPIFILPILIDGCPPTASYVPGKIVMRADINGDGVVEDVVMTDEGAMFINE